MESGPLLANASFIAIPEHANTNARSGKGGGSARSGSSAANGGGSSGGYLSDTPSCTPTKHLQHKARAAYAIERLGVLRCTILSSCPS